MKSARDAVKASIVQATGRKPKMPTKPIAVVISATILITTVLASCRSAPDINRVTISGTEYAFGGPPSIHPGMTAFSFENRGKVKHEMILLRLKEGTTLKQVLDSVRSGGQPDSLFDRLVGILITMPGQRSDGELLIELTPRRTYAMICTFRDRDDKPPHMGLGMAKSFTTQ
ncbi:MAG TPA: hypothetical protein VGJ36_00890 [Gemmatimonadales bacterium]